MVFAAVILPLVTYPERAEQEAELAAEREASAAAAEAAEREQELDEAEAALADLRASQAQFDLYVDRAGEYRWRLRHRNGNVLADSGEGYSGRSEATAAVTRLKRHAPNADEEAVET